MYSDNSISYKILLLGIVFIITLAFADSAFGASRIAVVMSHRSEIHSLALASFLQSIIMDLERAEIFTFGMEDKMETERITDMIQNSNPDLVLAVGTRAALGAKKAVKDIPIVFCMVLNPVSSGLVTSMRSPGGNITGASLDIPIETQFRYMKSVVDNISSIGVLYNPEETGTLIKEASRIARNMNMKLTAKPVSSERAVPDALRDLLGSIDILWSVADGTVFPRSTEYILLNTLRSNTPFMGLSPPFVKAGALLALSCDYGDIGKQAAELAIRILRGERPGNISVTAPRNIYLSINMKTAKHLGLSIPDRVIESANEVIE
jgi:putative ABC transport system substrate-binding protein